MTTQLYTALINNIKDTVLNQELNTMSVEHQRAITNVITKCDLVIQLRNQLIIENQYLIKKAIKIKFHTKNRQKKDELFSIGIDGLMLAIDKYNLNKGLSFSSYAISKIIFHFIDIFFWFIW